MADMAGVALPPGDPAVKERWALFAIPPPDTASLSQSWINLHLLLWIYTIYHLTCVATEDATFAPHEVWQAAWAQFESKAKSKSVALKARYRRARSRGDPEPDLTGASKLITPFGHFTETGDLKWDPDYAAKLAELRQPPAPTDQGQ